MTEDCDAVMVTTGVGIELRARANVRSSSVIVTVMDLVVPKS